MYLSVQGSCPFSCIPRAFSIRPLSSLLLLFPPFALSLNGFLLYNTHTHKRGISADSFVQVYYFLRPAAFFHPASLSPHSRRILYPRFPVDPLHQRSNDRIFDEANRERERDWRPRGIVKNFPCNRRETRSLRGGWGQGARKAAKCKPVIPCTLWLN